MLYVNQLGIKVLSLVLLIIIFQFSFSANADEAVQEITTSNSTDAVASCVNENQVIDADKGETCCENLEIKLSSSNGKTYCVKPNSCNILVNNCQKGYQCENTFDGSNQSLMDAYSSSGALQYLTINEETGGVTTNSPEGEENASEVNPLLAKKANGATCEKNDECNSNSCILADTVKRCMAPQNCNRCYSEFEQKASKDISCCNGLIEQAGFCLAGSIPPVEESLEFNYKVNDLCGVEWENPDDVLSVHLAEYWMSGFEFIFMSEFNNLKNESRDSTTHRLKSSYFNFNNNNMEIAHALMLQRMPIDMVTDYRLKEYQDILLKFGQGNIKMENLENDAFYFFSMSDIFEIFADRATQMSDVHSKIIPLFSPALNELDKHYWGDFQGSTSELNPRSDEPGDYNSSREWEYNICSKVEIHDSDSTCIERCLDFDGGRNVKGDPLAYIYSSTPTETATPSSPNDPAVTNISNSNEDETSEEVAVSGPSQETYNIKRLNDPIFPTFDGDNNILKPELVTSMGSNLRKPLILNNYNEIKNTQTNSSVKECKDFSGKIITLPDMKNFNVKSSDYTAKITVNRKAFYLMEKDETTNDYFLNKEKPCDPHNKETIHACRWSGDYETCYIKAPAILKNKDKTLKTAKSLLIGSTGKEKIKNAELEIILFSLFYPSLLPLGIQHYQNQKEFNYKGFDGSSGAIFQKNLAKIFDRYSKIHYMRFSRLPDPTGQFAINDGLTIAKSLVQDLYFMAFNQDDGSGGHRLGYDNSCHWGKGSSKRSEFLRKTMYYSSLLQSFYKSSGKAWKDAAQCMRLKPFAITNNEGNSTGAETTTNLNQNGTSSSSSMTSYTSSSLSSNIGVAKDANVTRNSGIITNDSATTGPSLKSNATTTSIIPHTSASQMGSATSKGSLKATSNKAIGKSDSNLNLKSASLKKSIVDRKANGKVPAKILDKIADEYQGLGKATSALLKNVAKDALSSGLESNSTFTVGNAPFTFLKETDFDKEEVVSNQKQDSGSATTMKSGTKTRLSSILGGSNKYSGMYVSNTQNSDNAEDFNKLMGTRKDISVVRNKGDETNLFDILNSAYRKSVPRLSD